MHYLSITFANFDHQLVAETVSTASNELFENVSEYALEENNNTSTVTIDTPFALNEDEIEGVAMKLFELGLNDFEINATEDFDNISEITLEDNEDFHEYFGYPGYVDEDGVWEAEYQGRKVKLGKPMAGDVKKFKVYVKNPKGNVVKVNFGQKGMKIKKNNAARRRSFRARHNCDNPGPRHKARYWSCRKW